MPEEDKENKGFTRRLCPQCRTCNYYKKEKAGEVSFDGGETYEVVDAFRCRDCKQDYMEVEMLTEHYSVAKFKSTRDGETKFEHMHKDHKAKMHERRQERRKKEGKSRDNWILKQLKKRRRK